MKRKKKVTLVVFSKCHIHSPNNLCFSLCMHIHENCYLSKEILLTSKHQGENNSYNYEGEEAAVVVMLWVRSLSYVKAKNERKKERKKKKDSWNSCAKFLFRLRALTTWEFSSTSKGYC
jgi:hypothetical protein